MQKYRRKNTICWQNNYLFNEFADNKRTTFSDNKNTKLVYIILFFIILLFILFNNTTVASATSKPNDIENIEKDLINEIDKELDKLNLSSLDEFVKSVENNVGKLFDTNVKELMKKIMKGEMIIDFDSFMNYLYKCIKSIFTRYLPIIFFVVFIAVLSSVLNGLTSGFSKKSTIDIINIVCYFAIIIVLFTALSSILLDVKNTIFAIKKLMEICFPILLTLIVALGGVSTSSIYKPLMLILSDVIVSVILKLIIPFFIAGIVLSIVGNMSDTVKITKLPKFFTTCSGWILGTMFSLFSAFVSINGVTGIMVDKVSVNATKFCLSSYVPILGGYVSDGLDLVLASCMLIKNSFGVVVLIIMILTVITPILKVLFFVLSLKLVVACIEPIADSKICNMVECISNNLTMLISSLVGLAFMFFIFVMLIINTINFAI